MVLLYGSFEALPAISIYHCFKESGAECLWNPNTQRPRGWKEVAILFLPLPFIVIITVITLTSGNSKCCSSEVPHTFSSHGSRWQEQTLPYGLPARDVLAVWPWPILPTFQQHFLWVQEEGQNCQGRRRLGGKTLLMGRGPQDTLGAGWGRTPSAVPCSWLVLQTPVCQPPVSLHSGTFSHSCENKELLSPSLFTRIPWFHREKRLDFSTSLPRPLACLIQWLVLYPVRWTHFLSFICFPFLFLLLQVSSRRKFEGLVY